MRFKLFKIFTIILSFFFLTGFVPILSFIGPGVTALTSGNIYKASAQYIINQRIEKETGKNSLTLIKDTLIEETDKKIKKNKFIDNITKKKINEETLRLLEIQKDYMIKFLMKIPKLYYTKSHFPLEISQRAFDHLWRVCESYEMWCKETDQEDLIYLNIIE